MSKIILALLAFTALVAVGFCSIMPEQSSILLTDIKALTLYNDKYTTARRVEPILQLQCLGGGAKSATYYHPSVAQCRNIGTDDKGEVQWECNAELEPEVKFGRLEINCEGYDYAEDPYVLQGSCGMAYTLEYTALYYQKNPSAKGSFASGLGLIFIIIAIVVVCANSKGNNNRSETGSGGFWSGFLAGAASRSGGHRSSRSSSSSRSSKGFGGTKRR